MTISVNTARMYDEIVEFIAAGVTPQDLIAFKLSAESNQRLSDLVSRSKTERLSSEEKKELDQYLVLEHLLIHIKARAHKNIL